MWITKTVMPKIARKIGKKCQILRQLFRLWTVAAQCWHTISKFYGKSQAKILMRDNCASSGFTRSFTQGFTYVSIGRRVAYSTYSFKCLLSPFGYCLHCSLYLMMILVNNPPGFACVSTGKRAQSSAHIVDWTTPLIVCFSVNALEH